MGAPPAPGPADYFSPGDWNITCSICGTKMKFSQAVRNWQGQWRHPRCDEPRHPQDFVHARNAPEMEIPYSQRMGEAFIYVCLQQDTQPMPGQGVPGCMLPGSGTLIPPCTTDGISAYPGKGMPGCMIPDSPPVCTVSGTSALPGFAIPGCMIPGNLRYYIFVSAVGGYAYTGRATGFNTTACSVAAKSAIPGNTTPGCMIPGGT